jgi:hypothetical protein
MSGSLSSGIAAGSASLSPNERTPSSSSCLLRRAERFQLIPLTPSPRAPFPPNDATPCPPTAPDATPPPTSTPHTRDQCSVHRPRQLRLARHRPDPRRPVERPLPGPSTLLTRARYALFVPWCFENAAQRPNPRGAAVRNERTLINGLRRWPRQEDTVELMSVASMAPRWPRSTCDRHPPRPDSRTASRVPAEPGRNVRRPCNDVLDCKTRA